MGNAMLSTEMIARKYQPAEIGIPAGKSYNRKMFHRLNQSPPHVKQIHTPQKMDEPIVHTTEPSIMYSIC